MAHLARLSTDDRTTVLRFAATFLWADLAVAPAERDFLRALARELDLDAAGDELEDLLARPPIPEDVDPGSVRPALADVVRGAVLRAIAADGCVHGDEMKLFEILDDLLPGRGTRSPPPGPAHGASPARSRAAAINPPASGASP